MKKLFKTLFTLALLATSAGAQQTYRTWNAVGFSSTQTGTTNFGTNVMVAASANLTAGTMARYVTNYFLAEGPTVDCRVDFSLRGAGSSAVPITLQRSYDFKRWETFTAFSVTANGSTAVTLSTNNLALGNYGYVRCSEINNTANASGITNLSIRFSSKR